MDQHYQGWWESTYCKLGKENTEKRETSFLDLDIKIVDENFQVDPFKKLISLFYFRMPE